MPTNEWTHIFSSKFEKCQQDANHFTLTFWCYFCCTRKKRSPFDFRAWQVESLDI